MSIAAGGTIESAAAAAAEASPSTGCRELAGSRSERPTRPNAQLMKMSASRTTVLKVLLTGLR